MYLLSTTNAYIYNIPPFNSSIIDLSLSFYFIFFSTSNVYIVKHRRSSFLFLVFFLTFTVLFFSLSLSLFHFLSENMNIYIYMNTRHSCLCVCVPCTHIYAIYTYWKNIFAYHENQVGKIFTWKKNNVCLFKMQFSLFWTIIIKSDNLNAA